MIPYLFSPALQDGEAQFHLYAQRENFVVPTTANSLSTVKIQQKPS